MIRILFVFLALSANYAFAGDVVVELGSEDYRGAAEFEILADGTVVAQGTVDPASGGRISVPLPDSVRTLGIGFTNDAAAPVAEGKERPVGADRNLIVKRVTIGERIFKGSEFSGEKSQARGDSRILFSNTVVTIQLSPMHEVPVESRTMATSSASTCTANLEIVGYRNGQRSVPLGTDLKSIAAATQCLITITGYTSTSGPASFNRRLAEERAAAVAQELIDNGVSDNNVKVIPVGETTIFGEGQEANRRVVVKATALDGTDGR